MQNKTKRDGALNLSEWKKIRKVDNVSIGNDMGRQKL